MLEVSFFSWKAVQKLTEMAGLNFYYIDKQWRQNVNAWLSIFLSFKHWQTDNFWGARNISIKKSPPSTVANKLDCDIVQCNPDIRELSWPENKSLISRFGLCCLGNTGSNLEPEKISLISGLHSNKQDQTCCAID